MAKTCRVSQLEESVIRNRRAAPRIHHQWSPDELMVEKAMPQNLQTALEERGHRVKTSSSLAISQVVAHAADGKGFVGAADPRAGGLAAGW